MPDPDSTEPRTRIIQIAEVGSTNGEAMRLAVAGEPLPFWLVARNQTAGRGRAGRSWASPPGNLYATYAARLSCPPSATAQLSLVAGIAVYDAVRPHVADKLRLKWPNDVIAGNSKLAGVLIETTADAGTSGTMCIIGIGINVASAPEVPGRETTGLFEQASLPSLAALLAALDASLVASLSLWGGGCGFQRVREAWIARGGPIGERLGVTIDGARCIGTYAGLDHDGALLILGADGHPQRVTFGDVALSGESGAD